MDGQQPTDIDMVAPARPFALVGARVWHRGVLEPATIVVDEGRIVAVEAGAAAPEGTARRDVSGLTVLPGFIDTHVHVHLSSAADILAGGVTTVRDLGSPREPREAAGATPLGLVLAGRILTPVGGYPTRSWGGLGESREVAGIDDARRAVAEQLDEGATVIKVALDAAGGPLFDSHVLVALVNAAHGADVRVTAHVDHPDGLSLAMGAGVDELAHLPLYDISPDEMGRIAEAGVVLCPTLAIRGTDANAGRAVAAFREAGGTVLYGTDLGNDRTAPGIMPEEVAALRSAGLSPAEVVEAATAAAAAHLGLPDRGRIEVDAVADLVAVAGDPFADPGAYAEVRLVLASGIPVRDELPDAGAGPWNPPRARDVGEA
jgi:imidazolonepropionase-like amidohydrolase